MKRYTDKEKKAHINAYWKKKDAEPGYSLRLYAAESGIKFYTLRDWYRDASINKRWPKLETYRKEKKAKEESEAPEA